MYDVVFRQRDLYSSLQDELSRNIFWARLNLDISPSLTNVIQVDSFCNGLDRKQVLAVGSKLIRALKKLNQENKKIIIHGTGIIASRLAPCILSEGIDFYAFCSRSGRRYPDGFMGKPAFPTEWLFEHAQDEDLYVLFLHNKYMEVLPQLLEHSFPISRLLSYADALRYGEAPMQYFEFPELYAKGTAFIDGGCYDAGDSIRFARWSEGAYSKIIAFEPDADNCIKCRERLEDSKIRNAEVIRGALFAEDGIEQFVAKSSTNSFLVSESVREYDRALEVEVPTVRIDSVAANVTVGMIKMDIEGAEYEALRGAAETIKRDKPLLAICVYHRIGDVPAIMDYCKTLVPEYRFWLRQHGVLTCETVLYAAV